MSYITKRKIALSVKNLVLETSINKTNVTSVMQSIHMRRQTFYDFFLDKYDAIEWIFNDELREIIEDNLDYAKWTNIIHDLCQYFFDNQKFINAILNANIQENIVEETIKKHTEQLIQVIVLNISKEQNITLDNTEIHFFPEVYSSVILEQLKSWIAINANRSVDAEARLLILVLEDSINGTILRKKGSHDYIFFD
ncbi:dihydroxyacetone kinase transcriptional activator DhaS [Pediococcus stilesii]|nr:dihydroxyacetone kinase transcriptional activator DhaS [Pediococcus stilesii]